MWMPSLLCLVLILLSAYVLPCFDSFCCFVVVVDFCLLFLPLWEFVIILCFVVRYIMPILVLQSCILMGKRELIALLSLSS